MTININNDDLKNILSSIIKSEHNKDSLVRLLHDAIVENSLACEWLVKMKLGAEYPDIPVIGTIGYLKMDTLSTWSKPNIPDVDIVQGFAKVIVMECKGITQYQPLAVRAASLDVDQNFSVKIESFIPCDDFDLLF